MFYSAYVCWECMCMHGHECVFLNVCGCVGLCVGLCVLLCLCLMGVCAHACACMCMCVYVCVRVHVYRTNPWSGQHWAAGGITRPSTLAAAPLVKGGWRGAQWRDCCCPPCLAESRATPRRRGGEWRYYAIKPNFKPAMHRKGGESFVRIESVVTIV